MKILEVSRRPSLGGAQSVVIDLSNWLAERGHDVSFVAPEGGALRARLSDAVRVVGLNTSRDSELTACLMRLARSSDVMHVHWRRQAAAALPVRWLTRTPLVEHAHVELPGRNLRTLSFRADSVAAVSPSTVAMVVHGYRRARSRVQLVGNTVPWSEDGLLGLPADRPRRVRVLGIGRLTGQKDPFLWIRVCSRVLSMRPDATACWLGEGPLLAACEEMVEKLGLAGRIKFAGAASDMRQELASGGVLLMTSKWEGLSLALLEAMAAAVPVVSTDVSGSRWALGEDSAVVARSESADKIASKVVGAFSDDGKALRDRYVERFRRDNVYTRIEEVLAAAASGEVRGNGLPRWG